MILLAIQQEADALTGGKHHRGADRQALRWRREEGFVVVDGQKVLIPRRRLRHKDGGEVRLGTYELFRQFDWHISEPLVFIEIQRGSCLGEDDIVRLQDDFGRVPEEAIKA